MEKMSKADRVEHIATRLEELFPETPIPLDHSNHFTLLVAVLLSAQCTDERVNKVTPALFEKADNPFDMLKLSVEEIREIIKPCGYLQENPKRYMNYQEFSLKSTTELCLKIWKSSRSFQELGTKLLQL